MSTVSLPSSALNQGMELTASSTSSCRPPRYKLNAVIGAADHLYNNSIGQCTETRSICSAQITPPARTFLESMRTRGSCSHNGKATDSYDSGYQLGVTEHTGHRGTLRQPPC
jgi:hypothetical protein